MYMDRILAPASLTDLQYKALTDIPPLRCQNCTEYLGTPYIYAKEKRPAFRMYQDAVVKKRRKLKE